MGKEGHNQEGSHPECTVIVSQIGPVISELCVGVCIIRSVNQSNKRCIYSDSTTWLLFVLLTAAAMATVEETHQVVTMNSHD